MSKAFHSARRGYNNQCIIRHFADGDTVTIAVRCNCHSTWHEVRVRIAGIESFEQQSTERMKAQAISKELTEKFNSQRGELYCKQVNSDKYGRVVGDIKINGVMLSQYIVENGLGWYVT